MTKHIALALLFVSACTNPPPVQQSIPAPSDPTPVGVDAHSTHFRLVGLTTSRIQPPMSSTHATIRAAPTAR